MPVIDKGEFIVVLPHVGERYGGIVHIRTRKIDSSNVEWIGWPYSGEPLLIVQYQGGSRYGYLGVSRQRSVALANHPSTGKYINERIKGYFECVKIR